MALSGHKTRSVFDRCNIVSEADRGGIRAQDRASQLGVNVAEIASELGKSKVDG